MYSSHVGRSIKEESQWKIRLRGLMLSFANTKTRSKGPDLVLLKKQSKLVLCEFSNKRKCKRKSSLCSYLVSASLNGLINIMIFFGLGMKDNVTCSIIRLLTLIKFLLLLKASKMLNKLYVSSNHFFFYLPKDISCVFHMNIMMLYVHECG